MRLHDDASGMYDKHARSDEHDIYSDTRDEKWECATVRSDNQTHMQCRSPYIGHCVPAHIVKTSHVGDITLVIADWCDVPLAPHNDPTTITWATKLVTQHPNSGWWHTDE